MEDAADRVSRHDCRGLYDHCLDLFLKDCKDLMAVRYLLELQPCCCPYCMLLQKNLECNCGGIESLPGQLCMLMTLFSAALQRSKLTKHLKTVAKRVFTVASKSRPICVQSKASIAIGNPYSNLANSKSHTTLFSEGGQVMKRYSK